FQALEPMLAPLVTLLGQVAELIVGMFAGALSQLMVVLQPLIQVGITLISTVFKAMQPLLPLITDTLKTLGNALLKMLPALTGVASAGVVLVQGLAPLIPLGVQLVTTVLNALLPVLPTLADAFVALSTAVLAIVQPLAAMAVSLAKQLMPVITQLTPIFADLAGMIADTLAQALPPLTTAVIILAQAFAPLLPVIGQLLGMILKMAAGVLIQLLPSLLELVQAGVDLTLALLPILPPLAELIGLVVGLAISVISRLLPPLVKLAGFLIGGLVSSLTTVIGWISGLVGAIANLVSWVVGHLGPAFTWLKNTGIQAWNLLQRGVSAAWTLMKTYVLYPLRDFFTKSVPGWGTTMKDKLVGAFNVAQDGIAKAWDKIKKATKDPINFVLDTVWNKGVVKAWDKILGWVPGLPELKELPLLAKGGTVPAAPGVFNKPTAIVGEGRSQWPEFVIPTDPRYRARSLALWQAADGQLMKDGGILGVIVGGIKNIGGKVGGFFSSAASFLKDPGKALDTLLGKLTKPLQVMKNVAWGKLVLGLPKMAFKGMKELVGFGGGGGGDIGGTIPKGQRLAIINQALAAAGVPPPGSLTQWQAGLNTLITRESGWNPRAINRWD